MAFTELGKLLEIVEKVVQVMDNTSDLPNGVIRGDLSEIKSDIFVLKQRVEFK